jgi:glycosyltransferase involved in cell wall biosynthesis
LLVALAGWWLSRWKRVPLVFEVRDLWPESLVAVGATGEGTWLHYALGKIAAFLYRRAAAVVVVTPAFKDHLIQHWRVPPARIFIVENGVETDIFRPDPAGLEVRKRLGVEDRFLICYIGTMGNAQGLQSLITSAEELQKALPSAMFLLVGEGAEKAKIAEFAAAQGVGNICFLGQQPRERIPGYISAADLCLVILKRSDLFKTVIPTKLLEYMACERPVLVAVDGQARQIIELSRAGTFVEPENSAALCRAIVALAGDSQERREMGIRGRQYIINRFSREKTARNYIGVLESLLVNESRPQPAPQTSR